MRASAVSTSTRRKKPGRGLIVRLHGTPVLHGALAYLECRLNTAEDAGDHTIFIAQVEDVVVREGEPLLYFRGKYHDIGPATNGGGKSAASEQADSAARK